jgi:hypothetical protein
LPPKKNNHLGKAGHLASMGELLVLGYNTAIPEVDVGDDVFVVSDIDGTLWRMQVKTSEGRTDSNGRILTQYKLNRNQVMTKKRVDLHYVFALRHEKKWDFVVMSRNDLEAQRLLFESTAPKHKKEKEFLLNLVFEKNRSDVRCWGVSFGAFLNQFEKYFPKIHHGPGAKQTTQKAAPKKRATTKKPKTK